MSKGYRPDKLVRKGMLESKINNYRAKAFDLEMQISIVECQSTADVKEENERKRRIEELQKQIKNCELVIDKLNDRIVEVVAEPEV